MSPKQKDATDNSGFDEWNIFDRGFFCCFVLFGLVLFFSSLGDEQGVQKLVKNLGFPNTAINKQVCRIFLCFCHQKGTHRPISSVIYDNIWYHSVKNIRSSKTWHFFFFLTFIANN